METTPQPSDFELRREEYRTMLTAGLLPAHELPQVARHVEDKAVGGAWERAGSPVDGDCLYVLSVAGTHPRTKIGHSTRVLRRIDEHLNEYHVNGHGLVDAWISEPLDNAPDAETAVRRLASLLKHRSGYRREEYPSVSFRAMTSIAEEVVRSLAHVTAGEPLCGGPKDCAGPHPGLPRPASA